ncbi:hypothetical protein, partial [Rivihabitans pingtungensis]|uniref:hypothetical protein n=1 Tax=Rivihabitans pingtungensis TaxID=1054498 RepID=UPI002C98E388
AKIYTTKASTPFFRKVCKVRNSAISAPPVVSAVINTRILIYFLYPLFYAHANHDSAKGC